MTVVVLAFQIMSKNWIRIAYAEYNYSSFKFTYDRMTSTNGDYRYAFGNIRSDQLKGEDFMQDGVSYQRI